MKTWLRKPLFVLFSIVTFGMISPPPALTIDTSTDNSQKNTVKQPYESFDLEEYSSSWSSGTNEEDDWVSTTVENFEEQAHIKFGERISPVIEEEFQDLIVPQVEEVLNTYYNQYQEKFTYVAFSQKPSGGTGEKIFHIYDMKTGEDLLRFHVRREHPPLEGYWFEFHYHTFEDQFNQHYSLGKIYWDENIPPNWMQH
ncbi:YpjP family protein [Bacillus carboniphilus]|uniref:YpjP family protein n=1 Tax=Bacillus carboniphilus TaxID=86663 RepID=A0ABY9JWB5_9BACI|nr:YpjP family protein [Bacillus carboniphilus]WLR43675.1 YpjP family protein [Bacillus carboniphilus]